MHPACCVWVCSAQARIELYRRRSYIWKGLCAFIQTRKHKGRKTKEKQKKHDDAKGSDAKNVSLYGTAVVVIGWLKSRGLGKPFSGSHVIRMKCCCVFRSDGEMPFAKKSESFPGKL